MQIQVSTNKSLLDIDLIHKYLSESSTWALGISKQTVEVSIKNSLCFGVYDQSSGQQVAFARIITDEATFANLVDVFVLDKYQGLGISNELMRVVMAHPSVANVRRCTLVTSTAPWLYRKFGFDRLNYPDTHMEIWKKDIYKIRKS